MNIMEDNKIKLTKHILQKYISDGKLKKEWKDIFSMEVECGNCGYKTLLIDTTKMIYHKDDDPDAFYKMDDFFICPKCGSKLILAKKSEFDVLIL